MDDENNPWDEDDLGRERFGKLLLACLQGEAVLSEEAFVVALTGKFGSGKSHFLNIWKRDLGVRSKTPPAKSPLVVLINAWESDFSGEPLLALVAELSNQLGADLQGDGPIDAAMKKLKRGLAGATAASQAGGGGSMKGWAGSVVAEYWAEGGEPPSEEQLDRKADAILAQFEARKESLEQLRISLRSVIKSRSGVAEENDLKMILIVDELDRCHPRYAIEFLEALKHVFNVKGLAVVLGVDWDQLCCTAKAFFGQDLNTEEYFRKFIKRKIALPEANEKAALDLIVKLGSKYFPEGNSNWRGISSLEPRATEILSSMLRALELTPRNQEGALHLLASYLEAESNMNGRGNRRPNFQTEFFIAAIWIRHPSELQSYIKTRNLREFLKFVRSLNLGEKLSKAGFSGLIIEARIVGSLRDETNAQDFGRALDDAGYIAMTTEDYPRNDEFRRNVTRFATSEVNIFVTIARRVVELDLFEL